MIIGVDHIALNVSDCEMQEMRAHLIDDGFNCVFWEPDIPNHPDKKILLSYYQPTHSIGLFSSNDGAVAIEITNHGGGVKEKTAFHYCKNYIELWTPNLALESRFWQEAFSFQAVDANNLVYTSIVSNWSCCLKLVEKKEIKTYSLDAKGYTCCALLTNNIDRDLIQAKLMGAEDIVGPFSLKLNKKQLRVVMFRSPGGAICELIQINKEVKRC